MISVDLLNINKTQHIKLIYYILEKCNKISFHFPGICDNGKIIDNDIFKKYHQSNSTLIRECFKNGAKQIVSKKYNGMTLGVCSKIFYVKPFVLIKQMLEERYLFDWLMQNNLPEDICFYKNDDLRFFSCSHDEIFYIYYENQEDIAFLKQNNFTYFVCK